MGLRSVEVVPSPKFQNHCVAPVEESEKVTSCPATVLSGDTNEATGSATGAPDSAPTWPHHVPQADEVREGAAAYSWMVQKSSPLTGSTADEL
jgi:hypothetical protein